MKKNAKSTLRNIVEAALMGSVLDSTNRSPGHYILRLEPEKRKILETLTSDDVKTMGIPQYAIHQEKTKRTGR